jgi:predicted SnoaL-like aldol condensation-catalyzing enzyme
MIEYCTLSDKIQGINDGILYWRKLAGTILLRDNNVVYYIHTTFTKSGDTITKTNRIEIPPKYIVYCKPTVQGADKVLDYLGRYVHRVAIANSRIISIEDGKVTFRYSETVITRLP